MMKQPQKSLPQGKELPAKAQAVQKKVEPPGLQKQTSKVAEKPLKLTSKPVPPEKSPVPRSGIRKGSKEETATESLIPKKPALYKAKNSLGPKPSAKISETLSGAKPVISNKTQTSHSDFDSKSENVNLMTSLNGPRQALMMSDLTAVNVGQQRQDDELTDNQKLGQSFENEVPVNANSIAELEYSSNKFPVQILNNSRVNLQSNFPQKNKDNHEAVNLKSLKSLDQDDPSALKMLNMIVPDATGTETDVETPFKAKEGFFKSQFNASLIENSERIELPSPGLPLRVLRLSYDNSKSEILELKDSQRYVQVNFKDVTSTHDRLSTSKCLDISKNSLMTEEKDEPFSSNIQKHASEIEINLFETIKTHRQVFNHVESHIGLNPLLNGSEGLESNLHFHLNRGVDSFNESNIDEGNDNLKNGIQTELELNSLGRVVLQMDFGKSLELNKHLDAPMKNTEEIEREFTLNKIQNDPIASIEGHSGANFSLTEKNRLQFEKDGNQYVSLDATADKKPGLKIKVQTENFSCQNEIQKTFDDIKILVQRNHSNRDSVKVSNSKLKEIDKFPYGVSSLREGVHEQPVELYELDGDDKDEVSQLLQRYSSPIFHRTLNKSIEKITTDMKRDRIRYSPLDTTKSTNFERKTSILDDANFLPPEFLKDCLEKPIDTMQSCVSFKNIQEARNESLPPASQDVSEVKFATMSSRDKFLHESYLPKMEGNLHTIDLDETEELKVNSQKFMNSMKRIPYNNAQVNEDRKHSVFSAYSDVLQDLQSPAYLKPYQLDFGIIREKYQEESVNDSKMMSASNLTTQSVDCGPHNPNNPKASLAPEFSLNFATELNSDKINVDNSIQELLLEKADLKDSEKDYVESSDTDHKFNDFSKTEDEKTDRLRAIEKAQNKANCLFVVKTKSPEKNDLVQISQNLANQESNFEQGFSKTHTLANEFGSIQRHSIRTCESSNTKLYSSQVSKAFSHQNSISPIDFLTRLMQKILVYGSKIEHLKLELFNMNSDFKIIKIFQAYSQGRSSLSAEALLQFFRNFELSVSETTIKAFMTYIKKLVTMPRKNDQISLNLVQFGSLFLPVSQDVSFLISHMGLSIDSNRSIDSKATLETEAEFLLIKQILIIWLRKFEDISRTLNVIPSETHEALYTLIAGDIESTISWKIVSTFLETNNVKFLDEDIIHIFRELSGKNLTSINFNNFRMYLSA